MDFGALTTCKRVLNLFEPVTLTVWKVMIERVTVVKFRVLLMAKDQFTSCIPTSRYDNPSVDLLVS